MRITTTLIGVALSCGLLAQQDVFRSRLTVSTGMAGLRGDIDGGLTTDGNSDVLTGGLAFEHFLSDGVSYRLGFDHLVLTGNDLNSGRADRALNFRTEVNAFQLGLRFYADNGGLLNYDARFAPFIGIGIGAGVYNVKGDLFGANGARYHYWSDGSIRDQAEFGPLAGNAQPMEQDGNYETDLTDLATETGKPSEPNFLFIPATIGVKWRISGRLSAELAFAYQWTFTDYLDDVSDAYPSSFTTPELAMTSNPTGRSGARGDASDNDHITRVSLGLSYSFGRKSYRYRMPPMHAIRSAPVDPVEEVVVSTPPAAKEVLLDTAKVVPMIIHVDRIEVGKFVVDTMIVRGDGQKIMRDTLRTRGAAITVVPRIAADSLKRAPMTEKAPMVVELAEKTASDSLTKPVGTWPSDSTRKFVAKDSLSIKAPQAIVTKKDSSVVKPGIPQHVIPTKPDSARSKSDVPVARPDPVIAPVEVIRPQMPEQPAPAAQRSENEKKLEAENFVLRARADSLQRALARQPIPKVITVTELVPVVKEVPGAPVRTQEQERVPPVVIAVPVPVKIATPATDSVAAPTPQRTDSLKKATTTPVVVPTTVVVPSRDGSLGRLDSTMAERIRTLELYILADSASATHEIDSLRLRITALDTRLDSLRNDLRRMKPSTKPEAPSMEPRNVPATHTTVVMDTLTFDLGSSRVRSEDRTRLVALAERIKVGKVERVLVTGHSDRSGNAQFNLQLTQKRADAVATILKGAGVPAGVIRSTGMGEKLARTVYDSNERFVAVQFTIDLRE